MIKVTVEVNNWQACAAQSPIYWLIASATGIVGSLAPLILFLLGKLDTPVTSPYVLGLLFLIYFVYIFHVIFGIKVIGELRKQNK